MIREVYGCQIVLCVGENGTGKTVYAMRHPNKDKGFFLDLEGRYPETLKWNKDVQMKEYVPVFDAKTGKLIPPKREAIMGTFVRCIMCDPKGRQLPIETFGRVELMVNLAIAHKIPLVVIDGIEDLRGFAADKFMKMYDKKSVGKSSGNWSEVNDMVRAVVWNLFNFSRLNNMEVILTTHFQPVYNEAGDRLREVKVGAKEYITDRVDEILVFRRIGVVFEIKRTKSPKGPTENMIWNYNQIPETNESANDEDGKTDE